MIIFYYYCNAYIFLNSNFYLYNYDIQFPRKNDHIQYSFRKRLKYIWLLYFKYSEKSKIVIEAFAL